MQRPVGCFCGHCNVVSYHPISSKYHIPLTFINLLPKFEYGFCPTNDNQDGQQNDGGLSVNTFGHSSLVICY